MIRVKRQLIKEECRVDYCVNNRDGFCMCINMPHNPEDELECDNFIPNDDEE